MKKIINIALIAAALVTSTGAFAQNPPPPNGGNGPTGGNIAVGGSTPIGSGLAISMLLIAAYVGKKTFDLKTEDKQ